MDGTAFCVVTGIISPGPPGALASDLLSEPRELDLGKEGNEGQKLRSGGLGEQREIPQLVGRMQLCGIRHSLPLCQG